MEVSKEHHSEQLRLIGDGSKSLPLRIFSIRLPFKVDAPRSQCGPTIFAPSISPTATSRDSSQHR